MNEREKRAMELNVSVEDLIWSDKCHNPDTLYHHEDGTIKGEVGYWVLR